MTDLERLAKLIEKRNLIEAEISSLTGRPAEKGHIGEYIASRVFNISLHRSATQKGSDGTFTEGPLAGRTVNIKWYAKRQGILDINPGSPPDYYLVLTGPKALAAASRGDVRPSVVESVFLFEVGSLITSLEARGIKIGIATSVAEKFWENAEVFPKAKNGVLLVTENQRKQLELFRRSNSPNMICGPF